MYGQQSPGLNAPRCYICGRGDNPRRGVFVAEATAEECKALEIPPGVGLCTGCAVEAPKVELDPLDQLYYETRLREIAEELPEDLAHEEKEWSEWSNTYRMG